MADTGSREQLGASAVGVAGGSGVAKLPTGIGGFDHICMGGLPQRRVTVVAGTAGSAKTVFAGQFLAEGVRLGQSGVFVTLEESADDLRSNFATLGWDIPQWEAEHRWRFVDASPVVVADDEEPPPYSFDTLAAQIGQAVDRTGAERIVIDSLGSALAAMPELAAARHRLRRLLAELRRLGLTVVLTVETEDERDDPLSRFGVEQFVADNVVVLRNTREDEKRRRTVEVLKMRGAMHRKGDYPFTILPGQGLVVIPVSVVTLTQSSSDLRVTSGNAELDALCHGGFFRDSVVLVSGATGTGKTLMVTEFLDGGAQAGERTLLMAYEESRDQLLRNARGWGRDFAALEEKGLLKIVATYPEVASLEDHLVEIRHEIESFRPARIAVDSLSALERVGTPKGFREFLIGLTSFVKAHQLAAVFTASASSLFGGRSITEEHVSTLTDSIILLRYVESFGDVRRGLTVLKMRGSNHDRGIREFRIDSSGMRIGQPMRAVGGILSGQNVNLASMPSGPDDGRPPLA